MEPIISIVNYCEPAIAMIYRFYGLKACNLHIKNKVKSDSISMAVKCLFVDKRFKKSFITWKTRSDAHNS